MKKSAAIYIFLVLFALSACTSAQNEPVDPVRPAATAVPIQPTTTPAATAVTEPEAGDSVEIFVEQLQLAVSNQDYAAMQALMSDPIGAGPWRSQWQTLTPAEMIAQFQNSSLPAPLAVQFTGLSLEEITSLLGGQPPEGMLGPDVNVVAVLHSSGWGQSAGDEALLFVTAADGRYHWSAFLYTNGRFADANFSLAPAPAGLIYIVWGEGIYQVQSDGFHRRLVDAATASIPNLQVSPDGRFAAYVTEAQELWVINTATGNQQQFASGVTPSGYLLWGDNDTLFVGVWLNPGEDEGPNLGHLATLDVNSGNLQILDEEHLSAGRPALLSDFNWVAFDIIPTSQEEVANGRLYSPDSGLQIFDPTGFAGYSGVSVGNPAWSPDPEKIAWMTSAGERRAVQVFDMAEKTAVTIFDWDPARFGALVPSPIWSPNGQWLALEVFANGPVGSGLWLLAADGSSQTLIDGQGREPYWASENELVFGVNDGPRLYNLSSGETFRLELPAGSWQLGFTPMDDLLAAADFIRVEETDVAYVLAMQDVPMHDGPGATYRQIGTVFGGQTAKVTGKDFASGWWRVICPDDTIGDCWVTDDNAYTQPSNSADPNVTLPDPAGLTMRVEQFASPDGRWQATLSQSEPVIVEGNERFYTSLTVADGTTSWKPIDEWRAYGLGYTFLTVLQWSADSRYLYYANTMSGEGCTLFINAIDLYQFDIESGGSVELLPGGQTWNLALAPDETQLAYTRFNGEDMVVVLRDVATYQEQSVTVTASAASAQAGNILWSSDESYFLLTVAHDPCGANWTHSTVRIDVGSDGLTAVSLIENDARRFTIEEWSESELESVRLRDKDENSWLLDTSSGELTAE